MQASKMNVDSVRTTAARQSPPRAEDELVRRAATDPDAFGRLYETYYSRILNYAYRRTLDIAVAEDITSNTFFKALRGLGKYRSGGSFAAWIYRIATNELKMHWRSQARHRSADGSARQAELARIYFAPADPETPDEIAEKLAAYVQLHEALGRLGERYRTVLVLRYFEGLKIDQIARVLSKRTGTVKSLIHRGLKRLRAQIESEDATFS